MSTQLARAKCGCSEEVHQYSLYPLRVLQSPLSRHEHSHWGALPPANSHWISYIYADCPPSLTLRCSYLKRRERWGWMCFSTSERLYGKAQKRHTTSLTWFCCCFLHWPPIPIKQRAPKWRKDWVFIQLSSSYKMSIKPELNWLCELAQETQELAQRYNDRQIKLARRHKRQQAWVVKQADATFQEVFSQMTLTDLIKLLPQCVSSTVPLCYMSRVLATTMQQDEDVPATTTVSEWEGSLALDPQAIKPTQLELCLFQ